MSSENAMAQYGILNVNGRDQVVLAKKAVLLRKFLNDRFMSRATQQTFTCPCGEVFKSPIYEYVNVEQDPHLQYVVLAGLLNVSTCPNCGRRAATSTPFVYSDPLHHVLAYVYPRSDVPDDAREVILEQLRALYRAILERQNMPEPHEDESEESDEIGDNDIEDFLGFEDEEELEEDDNVEDEKEAIPMPSSQGQQEELPNLQVVFGFDQLSTLINSVLEPEARMGRLALSSQSRDEAERGQFLLLARKLASEMGCTVEVEDLPDEYTVWLYGPRRRIGALMRELTTRG